MKLNPVFLTHGVDGEYYMVSTSNSLFKGIVKSNETAAFIVECLKTDTTPSEIVDKILDEYDGVDRATVTKDVSAIIEKLRSINL